MNEQKLGLGLIIFMPLLIGAALMIAPLVRRRFLMFSVRVAPGWSNSAEAQRIIRGYRIRVGCLSVLDVVVGYWGLNAGLPWMLVAGHMLLTFGAVAAVVAGRRWETWCAVRNEAAVRSILSKMQCTCRAKSEEVS